MSRVLLIVALYGFHRYILVYLYVKHRHNSYQPKGQFADLPHVTVQLPMYNEDVGRRAHHRRHLSDRLSAEKLEIQVLDDSTDHSADIARQACEEWAAKGYPRQIYPSRPIASATKPAHWPRACRQATGEFIAIFDADFVPPRDIL